MTNSSRLPKRIPVGTKYVLESFGSFVRRYLELPNGQKIRLATRKALTCGCAKRKRGAVSHSAMLKLKPSRAGQHVSA